MVIREVMLRLLMALSLLAPAPAAFAAQAAEPPAGAANTDDQNYIVGPGDVLQVDLLERTDFSTRAKVASDGTIQLPYIGAVQAANHTALTLRDEIKKALVKGGYFANPNLSVQVVSYASRYVTVLGSVTTPGLVPVDRAYRLSEIIARVGGVREGGADYVVVRPAKGAPRNYSVRQIATGEQTEDPFVSPGDTIFSPSAETFYISGQVRAPGAYPIVPGITIRMAISRGGGLTDLGSEKRVRVTRGGATIRVDLDSKVNPGDVVSVGERLF